MKGNHVTELLSDYMDGLLESSNVGRVKTHLIFCNICRNQLRDLESNREKLRALPLMTPSPEYQSKIFTRIANEARNTTPETAYVPTLNFKRYFSVKWFVPLAVSAVVMVVVWDHIPTHNESQNAVQRVYAISSKKSAPTGSVIAKDKSLKSGALIGIPQPRERHEEKVVSIAAAEKPKEQENLKESYQKGEFAPVPASLATSGSGRSIGGLKSGLEEPARRDVDHGQIEGPLATTQSNAGFGASQVKEKKLALASAPLHENHPSFLLAGSDSGIKEAYQTVITNQRDWKRIWEKHIESQKEKPPLPNIDLKSSDVIAIFSGQQMASGGTVEITQIKRTEWNGMPARLILYSVHSKSTNGSSGSIGNTPFIFKETPKNQEPTFFRNNP